VHSKVCVEEVELCMRAHAGPWINSTSQEVGGRLKRESEDWSWSVLAAKVWEVALSLVSWVREVLVPKGLELLQRTYAASSGPPVRGGHMATRLTWAGW